VSEPESGEVYREKDGSLADMEYSDIDDEGTLNIRYYAGDRQTPGENGKATEYGYITANSEGDVITIKEFKMKPRYEHLRGAVFSQFAERHAVALDQDIIRWNPKYEQNIAVKQKLINANLNGPKWGLNYFTGDAQPHLIAGARKVAGY
jgi:hypothetical protein